MNCKICGRTTTSLGQARILNKYDAEYFRCSYCGFVQPETPFWLGEAYSSAITGSDLGLVGRNIQLARRSKSILATLFDPNGKFVDYGGGYGMFVRIMRDNGFDFYRYDKFCDNLFSKGFDAEVTDGGQYTAVTAFEVFEHLVDPLNDIEQMLGFSKTILFSTMLVPATNLKPGEWWYYGLEHGQHVSLYTYHALAEIAKRFGLRLYSNRSTLHLLTDKNISPFLFRLVSSHKLTYLLSPMIKRKSLLADDYQKITGQAIV